MTSMQGEASDSTGPSRKDTSLEEAKYDSCDSCPFGSSRKKFKGWFQDVDYKEMKQAAERGHCQACAGMVKFFNAQKVEPTGLTYLNLEGVGLTVDLEFTSGRNPFTYEFFVQNKEPTWRESTSSGLYLDSNFGMIPRLRTPSGDTSSTTAFGILKHWLSRCEAEHTQCQRAAAKTLPYRVLEIKDTEPLRVRLVENCTQQADYACLSHRWGPQTKFNSLNKQNLDLYKTEVPQDKLYPLVRDAIEATSRLGLRFIWIDCYCIIQDDPKDWETEAAKMANIYENAFITISATFAKKGRSMFSSVARRFEAFQVTEIKGEPIYVRRVLPHPCIFGPEHDQLVGPSLKRAWVFQERLLSNRFIHFTPSEIFWECRESTWCECEARKPEWKQKRRERLRTIGGQSWDSITEQYNGTQLTLEKDRLPALAGVARRYGELRGGWTYLAGLWKEQLLSGLAWYKTQAYYDERPIKQSAPTWSWASSPRGTILNTSSFRGSIPLVGYRIIPPDADVYTGVKGVEITVEGPILDLRVYKEWDTNAKMIGKHEEIFLRMTADFEINPDDTTKYRSVPNGSRCLLLLLVDGLDSDWRGVFGIVLLQTNSSDCGVDEKFERIGCIESSWFEHSYVDESGEYAGYSGGKFPPEDRNLPRNLLGPRWLLDRASTRQVTLV